ncbi:MAG: FtsX-like permease family protein, partial [Gemmatimonadetes bacterium]|nr:FtsX-like permease family protein [Gemmatimonadota bacterium]
MRRTLTHYWKINAAVALGAAVAAAVLTGALLVGDSVRASLRSLVLDRLGSVDCALVAPRFFRAELAAALSIDDESGAGAGVAPVILLEGAATHADSRSRASVQILGIDARFNAFFGEAELPALNRQGPFPPAILNEGLAAELGAVPGDAVLLALPRRAEVPRATLFGRRSSEDVAQTLRALVAAVAPDRGPGGFGLHPHQAAPYNVFLDLGELQRELGIPGRANGQLARYPGASGGPAAAALQRDLKAAIALADLGLVLRGLPGSGVFALESEQFIIDDGTADQAEAVASELGIPQLPVFTYLANSLSAGGRSLPYSTVSALGESAFGGGFGEMLLSDGRPLPPLREGEIALDEWAAADLAVAAGDSLRLEYFVVDEGERLTERSARLRVAAVLQMRGLAVDRELTPRYPGIQEAGDMSAWSPPFPLDFGRIRSRDEAYWDEHGAAPKAFVSEATGKKLWGGRHGSLTSLRLGAGPGEEPAAAAAEFERAFLAAVQPQRLGMSFIPVRERSLKAAEGATDFGGLFIGFSLFLIAAAAMLTGLLFRLGVEQRAREMGLLRAVGMPLARVRRRFLGEGLAVAALGGLLGTAGAAAYAGLMMAGLRTLWRDAVGTSHLSLTVTPATLAIGCAASLIVAAAVVAWTVRSLGRLAPRALLAGEISRSFAGPGRGAFLFAAGAAVAALALSAAGSLASATAASGLFFASGALLLAAGVAGFAAWLRAGGSPAPGPPLSTLGLAVTSTRRQ